MTFYMAQDVLSAGMTKLKGYGDLVMNGGCSTERFPVR